MSPTSLSATPLAVSCVTHITVSRHSCYMKYILCDAGKTGTCYRKGSCVVYTHTHSHTHKHSRMHTCTLKHVNAHTHTHTHTSHKPYHSLTEWPTLFPCPCSVQQFPLLFGSGQPRKRCPRLGLPAHRPGRGHRHHGAAAQSLPQAAALLPQDHLRLQDSLCEFWYRPCYSDRPVRVLVQTLLQ